MTKQYRSDVMASIHETAEGLHAAAVMDKQTMRKFDGACLTPVRPLTAAEIKAQRARRREPGRVCPVPEHDHRIGEPVGARREAPAGRFAQAVIAGRAQWADEGSLKMTVTLDEFTNDFTPAERAKVAARTKELVEEELTPRDLQQAEHLQPRPRKDCRAKEVR